MHGEAHQCLRGPARFAEPPSARLVRRYRVRDAQSGPVRNRARHPIHPSRDRVAALHAGATRHPLRSPRFPLETLGLDRGVGAADHARAPPSGRHQFPGHRSSPPVRDRRRELPHRLQRLGLPAGPRGRSVAHVPRSFLGRSTRPAGGAGRMVLREALRRRRDRSGVRPEPDVLPCRGGVPRTAHDDRSGSVPDRRHAPPRPVVPLRRRVRPPRAVRHARTLGRPLPGRPVGRRLDHLAAVRERRGLGRSADRGRGSAHPRQLRRQALDDRRLVRSDPGRIRPAGTLGRHGADPLHRPRSLPG